MIEKLHSSNPLQSTGHKLVIWPYLAASEM